MIRYSLLIILSATLTSSVLGQTKNFIDQPYIETTTNVDTLVTPDRIHLIVLITEKDTKGKVSVEELETKMITSLKSLGIDTEKMVSLNDLASNFHKYFLKGQDVQKVKSFNIIVKDAMMAGKVILNLEKINISNVYLDKTEFSKIDALKLTLQSKAIVKAKQEAQAMTEPLNQQVGKALYISSHGNNYNSDGMAGTAAGIIIRGASSISSSNRYEPADIEFKKIKVETTVTVYFALE